MRLFFPIILFASDGVVRMVLNPHTKFKKNRFKVLLTLVQVSMATTLLQLIPNDETVGGEAFKTHQNLVASACVLAGFHMVAFVCWCVYYGRKEKNSKLETQTSTARTKSSSARQFFSISKPSKEHALFRNSAVTRAVEKLKSTSAWKLGATSTHSVNEEDAARGTCRHQTEAALLTSASSSEAISRPMVSKPIEAPLNKPVAESVQPALASRIAMEQLVECSSDSEELTFPQFLVGTYDTVPDEMQKPNFPGSPVRRSRQGSRSTTATSSNGSRKMTFTKSSLGSSSPLGYLSRKNSRRNSKEHCDGSRRKLGRAFCSPLTSPLGSRKNSLAPAATWAGSAPAELPPVSSVSHHASRSALPSTRDRHLESPAFKPSANPEFMPTSDASLHLTALFPSDETSIPLQMSFSAQSRESTDETMYQLSSPPPKVRHSPAFVPTASPDVLEENEILSWVQQEQKDEEQLMKDLTVVVQRENASSAPEPDEQAQDFGGSTAVEAAMERKDEAGVVKTAQGAVEPAADRAGLKGLVARATAARTQVISRGSGMAGVVRDASNLSKAAEMLSK